MILIDDVDKNRVASRLRVIILSFLLMLVGVLVCRFNYRLYL